MEGPLRSRASRDTPAVRFPPAEPPQVISLFGLKPSWADCDATHCRVA